MKKRAISPALVSILLTLICTAPFAYLFYRSVFPGGGFSLAAYYEAFLSQFQYLFRFWRSLLLSLCIVAGQVVLSTLAGYGFAKCRFRGRDTIFLLLMLLMILPLQVTLVPNYLMLNELHLLNTYYALALPMIFVPLGTFIMTQCFKSVPNDVIEAARLDGCGTLGVIARIMAPMNKSGLICTMLLSFLDSWNMVEQPIVFLEEFDDYPISVALATAVSSSPALKIACSMLVILPPLFLFAYYNRELVEGIAIGGEK